MNFDHNGAMETTLKTASSSAVVLEAVTYVRFGRRIVDEVNLRVEPGEHWVLLGPNGAGKSTLLAFCGAKAFPTSGRVSILGHQLGRVELESLRRRIGHVDPRHSPVGSLSVREVVLTGLTGSAAARQRWSPSIREQGRADELLAIVGMRLRSDDSWSTLSQGERTRALVARALVGEPDLLILDEPSTGLDVGAREMLMDAIDGLKVDRASMSSLLVTHHLEEIPVKTTHAVLFARGQVVASGLINRVMDDAILSTVFQHPIQVTCEDGRWRARTDRGRLRAEAVNESSAPADPARL